MLCSLHTTWLSTEPRGPLGTTPWAEEGGYRTFSHQSDLVCLPRPHIPPPPQAGAL